VQGLLNSKYHEFRSVGLIILTNKYAKAEDELRKEIFDFYLKNLGRINNWDLVDLSAPKIVGEYLTDKPKGILYRLARSRNLWERRVAIISTLAFIKRGELVDTLKIAEILLKDKEDLIHKAVGWALREAGKKSLSAEEKFLQKHGRQMPRTMLRYAIERFPEVKRRSYLAL